MYFLTTRPMWVLSLLVLLLTALAMAGPFFVRRQVALERLTVNNEVAGFKFATIGVLYAVLLAFVVVVVWERFNDAEHAVAREAGAAWRGASRASPVRACARRCRATWRWI